MFDSNLLNRRPYFHLFRDRPLFPKRPLKACPADSGQIARKHLGSEFFSRDLFESQLGSFKAVVIEMAHNNLGGIIPLRRLEGKLCDLWVVGQFALGIVPSSAARAKILGISSPLTKR